MAGNEKISPTSTRVILLAHEFPYAYGDAAFITPEIEAIAKSFDEVIIATSRDLPDYKILPLPENCLFLGGLNPTKIVNLLRGLVHNPRHVLGVLTQGRQDSRAASKLAALKAALMGLSIASHPKLRRYLSNNNQEVRTVVYSFWGRDIGYSLPWIQGSVDAIAVRLHRYDLYEGRSGKIPLQLEVLESATRIFPISDHGRNYILQKYPELSPSKVIVQRLGVEGPSEPVERPSTQTVHIVSCSSIIGVKRVDRILQVAEHLAIRHGNVRWVHFGDGPLSGALSEAISTAMKRTPQLTVDLRGQTSNQEVVAHYENSEVSLFINLSASEGIPVSIMEAIAWNIPVVATAVGGTPEIVGKQHRTGLLVDPEASVGEIVDKVADIINANPEAFQPHSYWTRHFNSQKNSHEFANRLMQL